MKPHDFMRLSFVALCSLLSIFAQAQQAVSFKPPEDVDFRSEIILGEGTHPRQDK